MSSSSSSSETAALLLRLLALREKPTGSGSGQSINKASYLTADGKSLILHSMVPITKVEMGIIPGVYSIDMSTKEGFPVTAVAGRGQSGDAYYSGDDERLVLKLDKRTLDDRVRESIEKERNNLAQIEELFGVYTEDNEPAITLMRAYTGWRLRKTAIFKRICEPVNDIEFNLKEVHNLIRLVKILTAKNVRYYLMKYHLLHTDIKDRNVLFTLDKEGFPQSAQLVDWGDAETVDPTSIPKEEVDALIEERVNEGWDWIYYDAKRRYEDAKQVAKAREAYRKKHHGRNPDDKRRPNPFGKKPEEKKDESKGEESDK
ncbi:hypothetical protein DL96DRAFT_1626364 [Flagelloscypha sp. PMI_526]|nr:hypothetical protein DL96DRAFT_1626364 [Flagelloscypha sp. PMI_526]